MFYQKKQLYADLQVFLITVTALLIVGGLFIFSASSVFALETYGNSYYFIKRQALGIVIGFFALLVMTIIPLNFLKKISPLLLFGSLILTALTLFPLFSLKIHGSSRWISIAGFKFQPSELLKISLIIYLGYFLEKKSSQNLSSFKIYSQLLIILGFISLVLLKQPDFGLTVTLLITTLALVFIAQFNLKHLFVTSLFITPASIILIYFQPYRLQRVLTFLNPWQDPQGSGFQIIQSLIAIGSGNIWGAGIAHSKQKFFYLPMQHTDFIFAIIAEETGFIGALFLLLIYMLFLYFGMRIANRLDSVFATFTTLGFVILTSLQAIINIAVTTGLMPTKGIGLPFVSYGNTNLVCSLCMIGLIINFVRTSR